MEVMERRSVIGHPENREVREQFMRLREYRFNASRIVPARVVSSIIGIVDQVEGTQRAYMYNANINSWLRYLDFSHVDPHQRHADPLHRL